MLFISQFRDLRTPVRALVYLFWTYTFVVEVVGIFMQIYVYQLFNNIQLNIISGMLSFTGLMLGFCVYGAIAAWYRLNARYGFLLSFILTSIGIVTLSYADNIVIACAAMLLSGIGGGFFWLTIHTYELVETRDHERDAYSTYLSAGGQFISLAGPAFATLLILISHIIGWGEFTILFAVTPFIFLVGFLYFGVLSDYRPARIRWNDVTHFLSDRRNRVAQVYLMGGASMHILQQITLPLIAITILGTALSVGGFNTIFAVAGIFVLLLVGAYRHEKNRLLILGITTGALAILSVILGNNLTFVMLVVYTLGMAILQPLMRVSEHVIDLQTMGSVGHHESDFYPTMIFRDISLWFWRMTAGAVFLVAASFVGTDRQVLSFGMYLTAGSFILLYVGARLLLSLQSKISNRGSSLSK